MSFEEYLISKKIDSTVFKAAEPDRWQEWNALFANVSEASFTSQKLYLINPIRRKYQLKDAPPAPTPTTADSEPPKPKINKPVFKPKIS